MSKQFMKVESFRLKQSLKNIRDYYAIIYQDLHEFHQTACPEMKWKDVLYMYGPSMPDFKAIHKMIKPSKFWSKKVKVVE